MLLEEIGYTALGRSVNNMRKRLDILPDSCVREGLPKHEECCVHDGLNPSFWVCRAIVAE